MVGGFANVSRFGLLNICGAFRSQSGISAGRRCISANQRLCWLQVNIPITNKALSSDEGLKAAFIGILFRAFLAIIKALDGIFGNSYALIADAIESTADIFTSGMLWLGLK